MKFFKVVVPSDESIVIKMIQIYEYKELCFVSW